MREAMVSTVSSTRMKPGGSESTRSAKLSFFTPPSF